MQIIDAVWEKQNLGVSCQEMIIESTDSLAMVADGIKKLTANYRVVKIPSGNIQILFYLQEFGYKLIEANHSLVKRLDEEKLPDLYNRFMDELQIVPPSASQLEYIYSVVKAGTFDTDRIALDPSFSLTLSGNRYYNWIRNELSEGSQCFLVKLKERAIGFIILKNLGYNKFNALFAALFPEAKLLPGIGLLLSYANCYMAEKQGGKEIRTSISSNNIASLRTSIEYGYKITSISYVLVCHSNNPQ